MQGVVKSFLIQNAGADLYSMRMLSKLSNDISEFGVSGFPNFRPWGLLPVQPRSRGLCFRARPLRVPADARISLRFSSYFWKSSLLISPSLPIFRSRSMMGVVKPVGNEIYRYELRFPEAGFRTNLTIHNISRIGFPE